MSAGGAAIKRGAQLGLIFGGRQARHNVLLLCHRVHQLPVSVRD